MYKYEYINYIESRKITDLKIVKSIKDKLVVEKDSKRGVIDINGNEIIKPIYDDIIDYVNGLFIVKDNNKEGIVDSNNCIIIDFIYNDLKCLTGYYFFGRYFSDNIIIDAASRNEYRNMRIDSVKVYDDLIVVKEPLNYVLLDKNLNIIKALRDNNISEFKNSIAITSKYKEEIFRNRKYFSIINKNGDELIKHKYKGLSIIDDDRIMAINNLNKLLIIDYQGKVIKKTNIKADTISEYKNDHAIISYNGIHKLIDSNGVIIDHVLSDLDIRYLFRLGDNYLIIDAFFNALIDKDGNLIYFYPGSHGINILSNNDYINTTRDRFEIIKKDGKRKYSLEKSNTIYNLDNDYIVTKNNTTILYDNDFNELTKRKGIIKVKKVHNLLLWIYNENYVEITDTYGMTIIPKGKYEILIINDNKLIINNKLVDLNNEYINIDYILNINIDDSLYQYSFSTEKERRRFHIYFEKFLKEELNNIDDKRKFINSGYQKLLKK